jgi:hypothetical protein
VPVDPRDLLALELASRMMKPSYMLWDFLEILMYDMSSGLSESLGPPFYE